MFVDKLFDIEQVKEVLNVGKVEQEHSNDITKLVCGASEYKRI